MITRVRAVRFHEYGGIDVLGIDVLGVEEVERPAPGPGQVLVEVRAAGIQPGEAHIRTGEAHIRIGELDERWPATFPSGQGSDLVGVVVEIGPRVRGFAVGDEVLGFTHARASHAEFVVVDDVNLVSRPDGLSWELAGSLPADSWRCRSPPPTRWSGCGTRSVTWNKGTPRQDHAAALVLLGPRNPGSSAATTKTT